MTVRAWVTLSIVALAALLGAFVLRVLQPIPAPGIVAAVGGGRLPGGAESSCWPQRGGDLRCRDDDQADLADPRTIPASGSLRVFVDFPVQPGSGAIVVRDAKGEVVVESEWTNRVRYTLDDGRYTLEVEATYDDGAFVKGRFAFAVD